MNFYNTKNIEEIIKHYRKDNNNYIVEYLNGKSIILKDEDNNYEEKLNKEMLKQAKNRDIDYNNIKIKSEKIYNFVSSIMFLYMINYSVNNDVVLLFIVAIIGLVFSIILMGLNIMESEELLKYRIFLSIVDELNKEDNKDIIKKYENNNLSININNLDSYSNKTIKKLKKELKHKN